MERRNGQSLKRGGHERTSTTSLSTSFSRISTTSSTISTTTASKRQSKIQKLMEGVCPRGRLCHYAHGIRELNYSQCYTLWNSTGVTTPVRPEDYQSKFFKTAICQFWQQKGTCNNGDMCKWAHGEQELRRSENGLPGGVGESSDDQTSSVVIGPQLVNLDETDVQFINNDQTANDRKRNWEEAGLEIAEK
ncbi:C3H1-type domain-containing protein [Meloidogyne graminicola]|uniref:C3H1-type domain-containing protein n=1 Tax=Meloidogyne graminicola TaxID=189291 RepID=A0A8S9ZN32_9BILA|nr:C3H1-type domain-containing protein [Meloidogyne graminicola]